jgi:hypothetical protein
VESREIVSGPLFMSISLRTDSSFVACGIASLLTFGRE